MSTSFSDLKAPLLFGVVAVGAAYFMVIKPKQAEVESAQGGLAIAAVSLDAAQKELAALGPQPDDPELTKLLVQVPRTADIQNFLNQISAVATQNGVKVGAINFNPVSAGSIGVGSEVLATVSADGARLAIDAFLAGITQLDRITVVDDVSLTQKAAADQADAATTGEVTAIFSILMFTGIQPDAQ